MELEELEDLFDDLEIDMPTQEQLNKIYGIYLRDLAHFGLTYEGKRIIVNNALVKNKAEGCFVRKQKTFDHIITRKSPYSGKRSYDRDRANKIHWIKCIIENSDNPLIKKIEEENGRTVLLWYEKKNYVVVLKEKKPDYLLVTGYCVDASEQIRFKKLYEAYKNKKAPLRE